MQPQASFGEPLGRRAIKQAILKDPTTSSSTALEKPSMSWTMCDTTYKSLWDGPHCDENTELE